MSEKKANNKKKTVNDKLIKQLKGLIFPVIITCIILIGVVVILTFKETKPEKKVIRVNGYEGSEDPIIMENGDLRFEMDPTTTQFTVTVKSTGKVWRSNPEDGLQDPIAQTKEKGKVNSTMLLSYSVTSGLETPYNNYNYCIENQIYQIEPQGNDCIKVDYSIGNVQKEYVIPPVTTAEKFEKWCELLSKDGLNMVQQYYKKYDIKKPGKKDDVEKLKTDYPIYETEPIYVLRENTTENLKVKMEEFFADAGYTLEDWAADKELNQAEAATDKAVFNVSVYYRLDGKDLVVEIPFSELEYQDDTPLYTLTPLPFFGAGGKNDDGYLMVPEGGGAKINFNNGKVAQGAYAARVYGWDMAIVRDAVVHNTRTYYNTFGISNGDDSFLCIMEDGVSYAQVQADISGRYNSYNFVNATYNIVLREQYKVGEIANSAIYVYLPELPDEVIKQRYRFIDSGDYVDMAKEYQGYLKENYPEAFAMNSDKEAPVVVEVISAVDKVKQVLGVPTALPLKLTTFKEAGNIMTELNDSGLKNMSLKLTGWMNGGVNQKILKSVKLVRDLGSSSDLKKLSASAKEKGIDLYLSGITQYEHDSDLLDGFNSFTDAARFISKERAELYQYSVVTYAQREGAESYYLLHTDLAQKMTDNLVKATKKYNANVAFEDTGMDLSADYYKKKTVTREDVRKIQMEKLASIQENQKVMIKMGNEYAAMYSDMITNMDLRGSEYTILDEYIPFYQLAIHGYKNYTGEALNLSGDSQEELLKSAEYGAGLYFTVMAESPFALQKTLYTEYFGANYDVMRDKIVETYNRYNNEMGHVFNQEMVGHKILEKGLTCTIYKDGTKVYVNYNYLDVTTEDGKKVPARDYIVVR